MGVFVEDGRFVPLLYAASCAIGACFASMHRPLCGPPGFVMAALLCRPRCQLCIAPSPNTPVAGLLAKLDWCRQQGKKKKFHVHPKTLQHRAPTTALILTGQNDANKYCFLMPLTRPRREFDDSTATDLEPVLTQTCIHYAVCQQQSRALKQRRRRGFRRSVEARRSSAGARCSTRPRCSHDAELRAHHGSSGVSYISSRNLGRAQRAEVEGVVANVRRFVKSWPLRWPLT